MGPRLQWTRGMIQLVLVVAIAACLVAAGCSTKDNSAGTERASKDLRRAQSTVGAKHDDVTATADDIERRKRDLVAQEQQLGDKEKSLDDSRRQLGSAQATLTEARKAYSAAVKERLAKLDAGLATLSTHTDAPSKDASVGLGARRDALATKLATMPDGEDARWAAYTKDVDATFDVIEHDLRSSLR